MTEQATAAGTETQTRAGKYLTFILAEEEYGLEILRVREIIGTMEITAVPRTPRYVKGVINLRGEVIPVVDLRLKVGMPEAEQTGQTCIIVVDVDGVEMGIIVDNVSEVLDIADEDIDDAPSFAGQVNTDFILGMSKADEKVKILLDISKLLSQSDISSVEATIAPVTSSPSAKAPPAAGAELPQDEDSGEPQEEPEEEPLGQMQEADAQQ